MENKLVIAIDFDGTCVYHDYPKIGGDIGAIPVLRKLIDNGHKLILFTMRSGSELTDAVKWFLVNEIPLHGVQYNPDQARWTCSNKCYANLYIDDAALGCPLIEASDSRDFVDWAKVEELLIERGIITHTHSSPDTTPASSV
jgi:hypothetical protein